MSDLPVLEKRMQEASRAFYAAKSAQQEKENSRLIGSCFKYRNNYSCPEKPSDYWWMYTQVLKADGGSLVCWEFQRDKNGKIEIDFQRFYYPHLLEGHIKITRKEFAKAWRGLQKRIAALKVG